MFTDIPWNFETSEIKKSIQKTTYTPPAYQRLTALGIDAFRLYPRLKQLETIPNTKLYGKTGSLQLSNSRVIHREQIWGMFSKGKPTLIPSLTKNEFDNQF
jgi:outer membrane PBP1 activator LpoA protein